MSGDADAVDQQRTLAADELDGVPGERLEMRDEAALGFLHQLVDLGVGALGAEDQPAVTGVDAAFVDPDAGTVLDLLEDLGTGVVDEHDAVGDQDLGGPGWGGTAPPRSTTTRSRPRRLRPRRERPR